MTTATQGLRREIGTALFVQKTSNAYAEPPRWLATGFSFMMGGENLSPENARALSQIAQANKLLSLKTLGGNFPTNERDLGLAYAESVSAVQYITADLRRGQDARPAGRAQGRQLLDEAMKKGLGVSLTSSRRAGRTPSRAERRSAWAPAPARPRRPAGPRRRRGPIDRLFGPALRYWQGVFGENTRPVLIGAGGVLVLGVTALIAGTGFSIWRRLRAEEEE